MTMTVIDWGRPQMVGNYYEPYRISWEEAVESLALTYKGIKKDYVPRSGAWLWRKMRKAMTREEIRRMNEIMDAPYSAGADPYDECFEPDEDWLYDEDDEREWERDLAWM